MVLTRPTADKYSLVSSAHHETVFKDLEDSASGKYVDLDTQLTASIRDHHPGMTVTVTPASRVDLIGYAAAGYASAELDLSEDSLIRWRYYVQAPVRGGPGQLADSYFFARYKYRWNNIDFIVYTIQEGHITVNYTLFPPDDDETVLSHSKVTDALLLAVGEVQFAAQQTVLVYDGYWSQSRSLYESVQKASWDDVILDKKMKRTLINAVAGFFDSEKSYKDLGVPWKRGAIFYGPAGNGKTISIKALMHTVLNRENPIVCLYVKAMLFTYDIQMIFGMARKMAPCLLILEDIDTLVTEELRSYFFNEVDGLENNNGIMMIATTNHLDSLDGGLSRRPSRFDRKYAFPVPTRHERILYCEYWKRKLQYNDQVEFPEKLCPAIADITKDFTFAYLKEAFVATLLSLARGGEDDEETNVGSDSRNQHEDDDIAHLPLWIEMQIQVKILREDMNSTANSAGSTPAPPHPRPFFSRTQRAQQVPVREESTINMVAESKLQGHVFKMREAFNRKASGRGGVGGGSRSVQPERNHITDPDLSAVVVQPAEFGMAMRGPR